MKAFFRLILVGIIFMILSAGCEMPSTPKTVTVTGLGWVIENLPGSYWSFPVSSTCFYDFWIYYSGNISLGDVEHARIYNSGKTWWWTVELVTANFTSTAIGGWLHFYTGDNLNTLPIGTLTAEIKLKNGLISSYDKVIPAPGSTTTLGYSNVYTEECGTPPANSVAMIKRPLITGKSINYIDTNLSIIFTINDDRVYNGWVWLYDSSNYTIGYSKTTFRNSDTGTLTPIISNPYNNDGTANTVSLENSDITFYSGESFNNIAKFILVVSDGNQFTTEGIYVAYDCRALSEKTAF